MAIFIPSTTSAVWSSMVLSVANIHTWLTLGLPLVRVLVQEWFGYLKAKLVRSAKKMWDDVGQLSACSVVTVDRYYRKKQCTLLYDGVAICNPCITLACSSIWVHHSWPSIVSDAFWGVLWPVSSCIIKYWTEANWLVKFHTLMLHASVAAHLRGMRPTPSSDKDILKPNGKLKTLKHYWLDS